MDWFSASKTVFAGLGACNGDMGLLAKSLAPAIEAAVVSAGAPMAVVGVTIAAVVLLPEGLAALRNARQPIANQFEPGAGLNSRQHRPDDSRSGHSSAPFVPPCCRASCIG